MGHDPKLIEALRVIKAKLEATPEPLRGPFLVKGLAPYAPPAHPMSNPVSVGDDLLNPDMPSQEMRLHMGEMTAQELRTARAAIGWANSRANERIEQAYKAGFDFAMLTKVEK